MTTWPRLRLSALGMKSAAVISNALDHLKKVADKLQTLATSCEPTKCCKLIQTLNKEYYGPSPTTAPGGASTSNHEVLPSQAMRYSILEQGILWTFSKHPHIYQTLFNGPLPPPLHLEAPPLRGGARLLDGILTRKELTMSSSCSRPHLHRCCWKLNKIHKKFPSKYYFTLYF